MLRLRGLDELPLPPILKTTPKYKYSKTLRLMRSLVTILSIIICFTASTQGVVDFEFYSKKAKTVEQSLNKLTDFHYRNSRTK